MIPLPSIGAYVDESWSLYKSHFPSYARITFWYAITVVIGIVSNLLLPAYGNLPFVDNLNALYTPSAMAGLVLSTLNVLVILPVLTLWITVGLIKLMQRTYDGGSTDPSEAMSDAGRVLLPAIGITILLTLLFIAVFMAPWIPGMIFIVLGIQYGGAWAGFAVALITLGILAGMALLAYLSVRYSFAFYEVVVGNATVRSSLSRSYSITSGKFWPIFWRWIVSGLIVVIPSVAINLIAYLLGKALIDLFLFNLNLLEHVSVTLDLVFSLFIFMVMAPLSTAFGYVLYRHIAQK